MIAEEVRTERLRHMPLTPLKKKKRVLDQTASLEQTTITHDTLMSYEYEFELSNELLWALFG